jgi:hypothetical protein
MKPNWNRLQQPDDERFQFSLRAAVLLMLGAGIEFYAIFQCSEENSRPLGALVLCVFCGWLITALLPLSRRSPWAGAVVLTAGIVLGASLGTVVTEAITRMVAAFQ